LGRVLSFYLLPPICLYLAFPPYSASGCAGFWGKESAAFSSKSLQDNPGEELSVEAKAALEEKAKRKAIEVQAARAKEFATKRKAFKCAASALGAALYRLS
jgi:hypothetical protein